ncbi:MAG TPA: glycosyltransferase [Burkholderiales bacterium]|jgi:predicted O-linked N-acetylglucosamine transferase (SPINDLY family)|nr:glycosyltransferase [Burkholderiales bacterium]
MSSVLEAAERAVDERPEDAARWYALGLARLDAGQLAESEPCWRKALLLEPRHARASVNLGLVLQSLGRGSEALQCYRAAAAAEPALGQAWFNLGVLLLERAEPLEAIEALRAAVRLDPGRADWHAALGTALGEGGLPAEAVASLRAALEREPTLAGAHSELLQRLNAIPAFPRASLYEEHVAWAQRHAAVRERAFRNSRDPDRRLRIGYLAGDFADPAIAGCLQAVLARHDRAAFEVFCYSDAQLEDPASWRLRALGVRWHGVIGIPNEQLLIGLREDGIDILVDLAGHSAGGRRMALLAQGAAPVQAAWLGYPSTTGLPAIEYRITDADLSPPESQGEYVERLVRLPGRERCFAPGYESPAADLERGAQVRFGSRQPLAALTPEVAALWSQILDRVPGARLVLPAPVAARFAAAGIARERIESSSDTAFDIALDAFSISSAAAAIEALRQGVPVVALRGPSAASRQAASILGALGLAELVAKDAAHYVDIAVALASDAGRRARLREELRERVDRSELADAARFTRELESAYRRMWRAWCANEPARPFDVPVQAPSRRVEARPAAPRRRPLRVVLDGVFFQYFSTGISRVWQSLLQEWVASGFAERIVLLDRERTAPALAGVRRRVVAKHDYARLEDDRAMLQRVCDEEGATVFASTYYSSPLFTPGVMAVYDMIPEVFGSQLHIPMWREKDACIRRSQRFVAISENTARDLCSFYPELAPERVTVGYCGVSALFRPAAQAEIDDFRRRHGIGRPYFLVVGARTGYKNIQAFLSALAGLADRERFAVVCVGGETEIEPGLKALAEGSERHMLRLEDAELRLAYAGALALAYPSIYEGFGMPVAEAMASGCPVITTRLSSLPEVAGDAALYVKPLDEAGLREAMTRVREPALRASLVAKGLAQARKFSWAKMASTVETALTEAAA